MLCSKCYKKISAGEEVQKVSIDPWISWSSGSEVFCHHCAIKQDKQKEKGWKVLICFLLLLFFLSIVLLVFVWNTRTARF